MAIELGDGIWRIGGDLSNLKAALSNAVQMVGRAATIAGGAIVGAMGLAVKQAASFGKLMANVATLGVTNLDELNKGAREVATTFGLDLNDAASTLYDTISAGIPQDAAILVMKEAARGAQAGVGTLAQAMDLGTSSLNAWNMKGKTANETAANMSKIMGQAATAIKQGKTTIADMASAIGQVAPVMASGNVKTEEFFAALAALTATGQPTSSAMAALRQVIASVISPTSAATKAAKKMGIDFSIAAIKSKGFAGFIADIQEKTGGSAEKIAELFGSVEALGAVLSLGGNQAKLFADTLAQMGDAQKNLNEMSDAYVKNNPELAFAQLKSTVQNLAIVVGTALLPSLIGIVEKVKPVIQYIADWIEGNKTISTGMIVLTAAVGAVLLALGPMLIALPALAAGIGALFGPVGLIIAGFAALALAGWHLIGGWEGLKAWAAYVGEVLTQAKEWVYANWEQITQIFTIAKDIVLEVLKALWQGIDSIFKSIGILLEIFVGIISGGFAEMTATTWDESKSTLDNIQNLATNLNDILKRVNELLAVFLAKWNGFWESMSSNTATNAFKIGGWLFKLNGWIMDFLPVIGGLKNALGMNGLMGSVGLGGGLPGLATGGTVQKSGWAVVGERGPELVQMPRGATVYDNQQTRATQGGAQQTYNVTLNFGRDAVRSSDDIREIERGITRLFGNGLQAAGVRML